MTKEILLVLSAAMALGASAQSTQKFTASKANEYALVYSLPVTAVDVVVESRFTEKEPGEFSNYARRHLSVADAITRTEKSVEVVSVTIGSHGVPNQDNRWQVQFKSGGNTSMTLTEGGIPLTINSEKSVAMPMLNIPAEKSAAPTPLETDAARQAVTQDMMRSTSLSKKAELAAARIFELREQRNELISGNAENMPPDGSALKVALAGLDAQEKALTAMFAGTTRSYTRVQKMTFIPGREDLDSVLCRISPIDGVVDASDLSGEKLTVTVRAVSRGSIPVNEKGEEKRFPKGGVAYNIPGAAEVSVSFRGKVIGSATLDLAQLGVTFGIDPALFSAKRDAMQATFSPITGAITDLSPVSE